MYIVACGANCKSCPTNGKDKCDDGQCDAKYAYDSSAKTCGGEYILVYFLSNVGINLSVGIIRYYYYYYWDLHKRTLFRLIWMDYLVQWYFLEIIYSIRLAWTHLSHILKLSFEIGIRRTRGEIQWQNTNIREMKNSLLNRSWNTAVDWRWIWS